MIWRGDLSKPIGYSEAGRNYLCALASVGYKDAGIMPTAAIHWDEMGSYHHLLQHYKAQDTREIDQRVRLCHDSPLHCDNHAVEGLYNIALTTWETDKLPTEARFKLNVSFDEVWVPSTFNKEVFQKRMKKTVHVVPHAVTTFERPKVKRPSTLENRYVFITVGSRNARKNPQAALRAYLEEFHHDDSVALIYKSWADKVWDASGEQVIQISAENEVKQILKELGKTKGPPVYCVDKPISREQLMSYMAMSDCLVSSHRGEGFGLALLEAKAIGNHIIATNWSGPVDFLEPEYDTLIPYKLVPVSGMDFRPGFAKDQNWAEPDHDSLRHAMRGAASVLKKGNAGKTKINNSLEAVGKIMVGLLENAKHSSKATNLKIGHAQKRTPVTMVSTFNQKCGIAIYTEELVRCLFRRSYPLTSIGEANRALRADTISIPYSTSVWKRNQPGTVLDFIKDKAPGILHIQHEFGFWRDDISLTPLINISRELGWKIVVTCHTVIPAGLAEERAFRSLCDADVLIALGDPGYTALCNWVEMTKGCAKVIKIPQGCVEALDGDRESCRKRLGIANDVLLAIHPGFITKQKRVVEIIDAIMDNQGALRRAKFQLLVAGSVRDPHVPGNTEYVKEIAALVEAEGLKDLIRIHYEFLSDKDLPVLLRAADLAVLNHDTGLLSNSAVLRQLQSYGVPVCAAKTSSLSDALEGGALLHETVYELSENLVSMCDSELRTKLRKENEAIAGKNSLERIARLHESLYMDLGL